LTRELNQLYMRKKILVVEDDPDQRELIRWHLKKAGYATGTASRGFDALVKSRSLSPDLIVLDLMLPGVNGFEICKALRRNPATAGTPVLMLTSMCTEFSRSMGFEAGINAFLAKPYVPDELLSTVEELLSQPVPGSTAPSQSQAQRTRARAS
jgi:two-component system, OmpR family, phosphate regulon response regulator PhoB